MTWTISTLIGYLMILICLGMQMLLKQFYKERYSQGIKELNESQILDWAV